MPHECTTCGRTFPDGSKEMLSGCPDCGGNKFQFAPAGQVSADTAETAESADVAESADSTSRSGSTDTAGTVERAAKTVRGWVSSNSGQASDSQTTDDPQSAVDTTPPAANGRSESSEIAPAGREETPRESDRPDDDRSWPSSDESAEPESTAETAAFDEWPETARRPEDRSDAAANDPTPTDGPTPGAGSTRTEGDSDGGAAPAQSASRPRSRSDSPTPSQSDGTDSSEGGDGSIMADSEDAAQADARSAIVQTDDLPDETDAHDRTATSTDETDVPPSERGRVVSEPSGEQPSIEELRAELNEQFESIKIVSPGQYELNLMELYNREEYIISLQEDGRYVIDVPDSWHAEDDEE
ncbi:Zn-ribbon containing protein [Natronolimnohabitans sp. A-GB9]|uniref:OapC/ArvC family zinc-ribbon domain-containing protein n=1 Tax=Natronolimnohabitans sp. A-GB9 TaxID=3069757 RepID=UPI0027B2C3EC|nr:Zn-ribbon containing protein [Natronolimnohabitans sp. A-GB9]MDQ2050275.1 Zn-ribbon containing protein [Natronolimnohabitans sp. A-GB9]